MISLRRQVSVLLALIVFGALVPLAVRQPVADAASTDVIISEFLAVNEATLADNTGEFEDWIELYNTTGSAVDLGGWTLADGTDTFTFPAGFTISSGEYLVVWASGDVDRTTASELHLPFKLASDGEPLTLVDPLGALSDPSWAAPTTFPVQLEDDSYGVASGGQIRYFTNPTPGSANGGGVGGLVEPVSYSLEHGFYTGSQSVVLDTETPGATIRYTTNGEEPTASNGTAVTPGSAINISNTTTLRAIAYRDGWLTSPIETRSYLFTSDIITQGKPDAWPSGPVTGVAGDAQRLDYGMDPNVVSGNEAAVQAALTGIPTISIVTDQDNLFDGATGIYVNADERGVEWERPASVELIDPSGAEPGFDIEAGLRIRGGFSRHHNNPKHALRLFFKDDYESELNYPLFGAEGDDRFEKVDLRSASNYAWSWRHNDEASFIDEVWSRDTQRAMGQPYTRSRQYHVYLNGTYWGLYMSQERVSGEFGESYFGGDEDDYDVVKRSAPGWQTEATAGSDAAWKSLFPLVADEQITNSEFAQIDAQVDIENLADYYLLHFWSGDLDGSPSSFAGWKESNNWYALRNRNGSGAAGKWQFFDHDSEHSLCVSRDGRENADSTMPWNLSVGRGDDYMAPAYLHAALVTHPAYVQIFRDRVALHMLAPDGALTLAEGEARLAARAAEVSPAIEAESARWGDGGGEPAYGRTEWADGVELKRQCLALRIPIVEQQLRADGLWPLTDPPVLVPGSGAVPYGTDLDIDDAGQGGTIYFTVDGTDPRAVDGSIAPSAQPFGTTVSIVADVTVKARVLANGDWTPLARGDYTLSTAPGAVRMVLNEFNAVSTSKYLGGGTSGDVVNGVDANLGRILGNGGDWVEFVVVEDELDVRGWTIEVWNTDDTVFGLNASLTFSSDDALSSLLAGSIITVSEDIADDVSYDPLHDDWHINLQSNNAGDGAFITGATQSNFAINNSDTQIAIFDAAGTPVQLRTGEGTVADVSVNSTEVFKLEGPPTTSITPDSTLFDDGTSSSWGLPNVFDGGAEIQDLTDLRVMFGDVNCDGRISIADALYISQYSVGNRTASSCPLADPSTEANAQAADVSGNGSVSVLDAIFIAQCSSLVPNGFCPDL